MPTSATRTALRRTAVSTALGLLLAGTTTTPVLPDSTRPRQGHLDAWWAEQMRGAHTGEGITVALIGMGVDGARRVRSNPVAPPTCVTGSQVPGAVMGAVGTSTDGEKRNDSIGHGIVRSRVALTDSGDPGSTNACPPPDAPVVASAPPHPGNTDEAPPEGVGHQLKHEGPGNPSTTDDPTFPILWLVIGIAAAFAVALAAATAFRRRPK